MRESKSETGRRRENERERETDGERMRARGEEREVQRLGRGRVTKSKEEEARYGDRKSGAMYRDSGRVVKCRDSDNIISQFFSTIGDEIEATETYAYIYVLPPLLIKCYDIRVFSPAVI